MRMTRTAATFAPPVMEARRWLELHPQPADRPLINVSQAAPVAPPPEGLRAAVAEAALHDDSAHLYGPVLGNDALRAEIARRWSALYGGRVDSAQVSITQGCNQAFCAAIMALCAEGDEVILPSPWYFNHRMWLDMAGLRTVALDCGDTLLPDPAAAAALVTDRTRAIVLVTPNNPGGVEYPAETLTAFRDLARARGIALILDETYRDFDSRHSALGGGRPHDLFVDPDWHDTVIQLYSFSKSFRLTGHRVGAITASAARQAEIEKFLDTVAICPGQLGQVAALWGMRNLDAWVEGERAEILRRRAAIEAGFGALEGWRLLGCGAYFAYAEHPFAERSDAVAQAILRDAGVLMLPGTMFTPEGSAAGARQMRIAFANVDVEGIATLIDRLARLNLPRRRAPSACA